MNPLLIGLLAGAGMGALKGMDDRKQSRQSQREWARIRDEQNKLNEVKSRYSSFTGHRPTDFTASRPNTPGLMGPILQGTLTGLMMGQQFDGGSAEGPATNENLYGAGDNVDGYTMAPHRTGPGGQLGRR